jgi:hypothetical protein
MGFIKPTFGGTVFPLQDAQVNLLVRYAKGKPETEVAALNGFFLDLDLQTLFLYQAIPAARNGVFEHIFKYLYEATYS